MPETILLALALIAAGAAVLWPLWRSAPETDVAADERRSAEMRHRVALEALRDVETDRRSGSLDDDAYAVALAEAEERAAATRAALDRVPSGPTESVVHRSARLPGAAAGVIGLVMVAGSLVPAAGIGNRTQVNEGLAAAEAAEAARQHRVEELTEAFAADPQDAVVLSELADAYLAGSSDSDLVAGAAALQLLIALEPDRADAYERIVTAYIRAGDFVNARAALAAYADLETADPVELAFLDGLIALRGEDDVTSAVAAFDRFLELAPDDARATMIRSLRAEAESAP